jgi:hypothetical protein
MLAWLKSLGQDFQRGLIAYLILASGLGALLLAKLKVFGNSVSDLTNIKISIGLLLLLCALSYLLGRMNEKSKWKNPVIVEECEIQPEGFYTNPKYKFEICPKCLHLETPKVVPMTKASGPWKCVSCDYKIDIKAACASSHPEPTGRGGFVRNWKNNL